MTPQTPIDNSQPSASPRSAQRVVQTASHNSKNDAETGPADGLLFASEDGLIRSVLDLTRELEKLGVIEIIPQSNGGDFYRIKSKVSHFRRLPATELAKRVGAIFRRRRSTVWSTEEWKAYRQLIIDPEDLKLVEEYYANMAGKENSYCRTTLLTFLRHYPGEVDRARRWKETSSRRHCY